MENHKELTRRAKFILAFMILTACTKLTDQGDPYVLDVTIAGPGRGTTSPPESRKSYPSGTVVTVTANPLAGSVFTGWRGNGCKQPVNPCQVLINDRLSVTAVFGIATGLQQYDGEYTGTMPTGAGPTPINLVIDNGAVQGRFVGPPFTFSGGTVSATGAFAARLGPLQGGCTIDLRGQITISTASGITGATATGRYTKNTVATCEGAEVGPLSGTWTATRDLTQQPKLQ